MRATASRRRRSVATLAARARDHRRGRDRPMTASFEQLGWPAARLGEALEALALRSRLIPPQAAAVRLSEPRANSAAALSRWLESTAQRLGVEAEPFACGYA